MKSPFGLSSIPDLFSLKLTYLAKAKNIIVSFLARLLITKMLMLRRGRFKHQLFTQSTLQQRGMEFHAAWNAVQKNINLKSLHPAEVSALYLFLFSYLRRPSDFLGGPHNDSTSLTVDGSLTLNDVLPHLKDERLLKRFSRQNNFFAITTSHSFRSIPHSAIRSLSQWYRGNYPLELLFYIPSPMEVLTMQCQGKRVVSLLQEPIHFCDFVETDRDMLGFLVHDLIHADHFFHHLENAKHQVKFSNFLYNLHSHKDFRLKLETDPSFSTNFFYISSDMNSVPLHLFMTFKAHWLEHFKRTHAPTEPLAKLSPDLETIWLKECEYFLSKMNWSKEGIQRFQKLNTPLFNLSEDYLPLVNELC